MRIGGFDIEDDSLFVCAREHAYISARLEPFAVYSCPLLADKSVCVARLFACVYSRLFKQWVVCLRDPGKRQMGELKGTLSR